MKQKIQKKISSLSKLSKAILKYGLFFALIFLIVSNILLYTADDAYTLYVGQELAISAFTVIAEVFIGAIIFDYFIEKE